MKSVGPRCGRMYQPLPLEHSTKEQTVNGMVVMLSRGMGHREGRVEVLRCEMRVSSTRERKSFMILEAVVGGGRLRRIWDVALSTVQ
jgi:hypothetical protein